MRSHDWSARLRWMVGVALLLSGLAAVPAYAAYSPSPRESWTANGTVFAVAVHGDRVYIGGKFTRVTNRDTGQSVTRTRLAAFDASSGALITSFNASANDEVRALAVSADGSTVFAGGMFTSVNGTGRSRLAALTSSGALQSGWNVSASGRVRDLVVVGSDLYIAGTFGSVSGQSRGGLAKVSVGNGQLSSWRVPTSGGRPWSIFPSPNGTDLLIGGDFDTLDGQSRPFLGAATLAGGDVTGWQPAVACDECTVFDVVAAGDAVYGGVGGGGGRAIRWSRTTGSIAWQARGDGNVQALAVDGGTLYVGGHFGPSFGGATRHQLAAVNTANGQLLPWNPQLGTPDHPGVWDLDASASFLRAVGGFRTVGGVAQARFAEFPVS